MEGRVENAPKPGGRPARGESGPRADDDRRGRSVGLTDAGRAKVTQLFARLTTDLSAAFAGWDPADLDTAAAAVIAVADAINRIDTPAAASALPGADGAAGPLPTPDQKDHA